MPELSAKASKSFDFAQDLTKLLITLATGIVTITITFLNDVADQAPSSAHILIGLAWLFFLISIVSGIVALAGMAAALYEKESPKIGAGDIVWPSRAQFVFFALAVALTIWFGVEAL